MDANAQSSTTQPVEAPEGELVTSQDVVALDATLRDTDWPVIQRLWRSGVTNESIYRLLRLRLDVRSGRRPEYGPHLDGFRPDARAQFARWLVRQGRLNEGL